MSGAGRGIIDYSFVMRRSACRPLDVYLAAILAALACSGEQGSDATRRGAASPDTAIAARARGRAASRSEAVGPSYVGLQYDSLPGDFKFEGGSVIPMPANGPRTDYDFAHVSTPRGDMVWLDTIGAAVGRGLRARIVRGELTIPPLAPDERLFMASCDVGGHFDGRIVAIVVNEANISRFTMVRQAWRVNLSSGRFDIIPVASIVSEEPGSG